MSEYIKTVVKAVIAVGIITSLFSENKLSKYINLISGIVVMAVLILPVLDISPEPLDYSVVELDVQKNTYLKDEFEKTLEERIKEEVKLKTSQEIEVDVVANVENEPKIEKISIKPYKEEYADLIKKYLNTGENGAQINEGDT